MTDYPSDTKDDFPEDETRKNLTRLITAALANRNKESKKKPETVKKINKLLAEEGEKARFEKTAVPKSSTDLDETKKNLTRLITAALANRNKESEAVKKPKKPSVKEKKPSLLETALEPASIMDAIAHENIAMVKSMLKRGVNLKQVDEHGNTPLINAVYQENLTIIKLLVKKGANINGVHTKNGKTPLMHAIKQIGSINKRTIIKIVKFFVQKGSNLTIKDSAGKTALHIANVKGSEEILKILEKVIKKSKGKVRQEKKLDEAIKPVQKTNLSPESISTIKSTLLNKGRQQPVAKKETPLNPESFARLHNGRSPIREIPLTVPPPEETANQLIELGFDSLENGHTQSSKAYFEKALKIEPGNITALTNLGFILCKQGGYELAEIPLIEALNLCSDVKKSAIIHKNLAITLFKQNKLHKAEGHIRTALKINPDDTDVQKLEILIAEQRESDGKRLQKADDKFFGLPDPKMIPEKSIMEEVISAKEAIDLAKLFSEKKDYESARKYLEKAVELDLHTHTHSELAHINLVYVYEMLASCEKEEKSKNIYLEKAKEHKKEADELKAIARKQADKAPANGQIDELFRPFGSSPFDHPPEIQSLPPQPQPVKQASDVQPGLRGQERGGTKEEREKIRTRGEKRLKYLCEIILNKDFSSMGWQEAVAGYTSLISQKSNLYISSVNHRDIAIKLRKAYKEGYLADYIPAIIAHTQDVLINKGDFEALAEAGLTHLEANQFGTARKLFEGAFLLNPNPPGKYIFVKKFLEKPEIKMLIPPVPEVKQEEFECPPTVRKIMPLVSDGSEHQIIVEPDGIGKAEKLPPPPSLKHNQSKLHPGEERVKIENLSEDQVPESALAVPPPLPPFTDDEWETGQSRAGKIFTEHRQTNLDVPPTLPSMRTIPEIVEDERRLKANKVKSQFMSGNNVFASIAVDFTEINHEQKSELNIWIRKYTELLSENPKVHFPHNATYDHLISLQEKGWVSNETMMSFTVALKKYKESKKAK